MGPFLLSFQLKAPSPEPLRACVGGGGRAGGTKKQHSRGAKAPLNPRSELGKAPRGTEPPPGPSHHQRGRQRWGGTRTTPLSPSPGGAALWWGSQDRQLPAGLTDTAPRRKQHRAPATRTDLGGRGGHGHTRQQGLQGLRLEHHQHPLQRGQGSVQSPSKPQDHHGLPRVPLTSAPESPALPH